jgi:hypothetical protein
LPWTIPTAASHYFQAQNVLAKFQTHAEARQVLLLSTGEEQLIEKTSQDHSWGCGSTGTGSNRLGQILMEVRALLRARPSP